MERALIRILPLFWINGVSLSREKTVLQTPADVIGELNNHINLTCSHNIQSYETILWYQRSLGDTALKLIGYTSYTVIQKIEEQHKDRFDVSGNGQKEAYLHILKLRHPEDGGQYVCAACIHND